MRVPAWVTIGVAILVIGFGLYRIRMALRKPDAEADAKRASMMGGGFYKMSPRSHLFVGIMYLALGGALVATSFGWNPLGGMFGPKTEAPASKDAAPAKPGSVPVDVKH